MTRVGHVWAVATNLFAIVVVLAMFGVAATRFETVVVSGLTLIYVSVISSFTLLGRSSMELAQGLATEFLGMKRLLNDARAAEYEEELNEARQNYGRLTVRFYINGSFTFVIWMIAVWHLLGAAF